MPRPLPQKFYRRDAREVARGLLGKHLVMRSAGQRHAGMITETEAYCGPHDLACHASKGRTARTEVMFGPPGHWYIYLIYGMYWCLNIVTERKGYPAAVLIRGVRPPEGFPCATKTDGPGKLCRAFGIDKTLNGTPAFRAGALLTIEESGEHVAAAEVHATPRIGIEYAGEYKDKPWRYVLDR